MNESKANNLTSDYECLIAGGGPGGAIAAITLARAGISCAVLEKQAHPRFHIGESILPCGAPLLHEMGLWDKIKKLPNSPKFGISFAFGDNFKYQPIVFDEGLEKSDEIFNIERAEFDKLLLDEARRAGATVLENCNIKKITRLSKGDVKLETTKGSFSGRMLLDASGYSAIVGRHLNTRQIAKEDELKKVAYFSHFTDVNRPDNKGGGSLLVMCDEGWFWIIGLDDEKTSVGFVANPTVIKRAKVGPDDMLRWAIGRCPVMQEHIKNAKGWDKNKVLADFSYSCAPFAGEGYFLVGDAACFLDPIFSTGVSLAMISGREAANHTINILNGKQSALKARNSYCKLLTSSTDLFRKIICSYYHHSFREILMCSSSPLKLRPAFISIVAGYIFPKMRWRLRWRLNTLFIIARLQRHHIAFVPRWKKFSLFDRQ